MRDDQHRFVGMTLEYLLDERLHPAGEIHGRLCVVRTRALAGAPASVLGGELSLDLRPGLSFPRAERALAEPSVDANGEPVPGCKDVGRLSCPREVARVDHVDAVELAGESRGLLAADVVEGRVRLALPATLPVPVGFAVANEEEGGHETH